MRTRCRDSQVDLAWRQLMQAQSELGLLHSPAEQTRRAIERSRKLLEQTSGYIRLETLARRRNDRPGPGLSLIQSPR